MRAPRLNRALVLESRVPQPDGAGGYVEVWEAVGTLWAEVLAGTGRHVTADQIAASSVTYRITVRAALAGAPSRPRPDQRFRDGLRVFRILAVAERDGEARYLTCFAEEEVPA